jgi:hypothetical protein
MSRAPRSNANRHRLFADAGEVMAGARSDNWIQAEKLPNEPYRPPDT